MSDDIDSPDYNDTNVGSGFVESAEERRERKEAERVKAKIADLERENAKLREERDAGNKALACVKDLITRSDDFSSDEVIKVIEERVGRYSQSIEWFAPKALRDEVTQLRSDLAAANERAERAEKAIPSHCPVTGLPFFMMIGSQHDPDVIVPTYGGPYDSYTIPDIEEADGQPLHEREFIREKFDHDVGGWSDGCESLTIRLIEESELIELTAQSDALRKALDDATGPTSPWDCHEHRSELQVSKMLTVYHAERGQLCVGEKHWDGTLWHPIQFKDAPAAWNWIKTGHIAELQEGLCHLAVRFSRFSFTAAKSALGQPT